MALGDVPVRRLPTEARSGAENMALDAIAADRAAADGIASIRVYEWAPSTLTLGYAQASETVDWAFCEEAGIHVTRRPTGGGGIYHDRHGDIAYSIVAPSDVLPSDLTTCYRRLCQPIIDAMQEMGVDVAFSEVERDAHHEPACYLRALHPSHDLVVEGDDRVKKISGNAQYRRKSAVVQHGSITFASRPGRHVACFADPALSAEAFDRRVTAIDRHANIDRSTAVTRLERSLHNWAGAETGTWTEPEQHRMRELVDTKFGADRWVEHRETPPQEA